MMNFKITYYEGMKLNSTNVCVFSLIFLLFLQLNLSLFNLGQYTFDVKINQQWGNKAFEHGIASLYTEKVSWSEEKTSYPPLFLYVLEFNSWLSLKLFGNNDLLSHTYNYITKIIPTLCNLIIGLAIFLYLREKNHKIAILGMCFYLFNPAIIYNTAYWGQFDSAYTILMFASIIFLLRKCYVRSSVFLLLAILTKVQSVVLLPVLIIVLLKDFDFKKMSNILITNFIVALIVMMPFILGGVVWNVWSTIAGSVDFSRSLTVNAYNLWYIISPAKPNDWQNLALDSKMFWGISFKALGIFMFFVFTFLTAYQLFKKTDERNIILASASMVFAFFILPTQIHERYLFPFFALLCPLALTNRKYLSVYLILTITHFFNLLFALPFDSNASFLFYLFQEIFNLLINTFSLTTVGVGITAINIATFIYFNKIGILAGFFNNVKNDMLRLKKYMLSHFHP